MKRIIVLMLAMVLLVSTVVIAAPIDSNAFQQHISQYDYTVIATAGPMDEAVLKDMNSRGWNFLTVMKHKKKHFWYFIKPTEMWLNQQQ